MCTVAVLQNMRALSMSVFRMDGYLYLCRVSSEGWAFPRSFLVSGAEIFAAL